MIESDNDSQNRQIIELVALEWIKEKRRKRRWNLFFRFLFVGIVVVGLISLVGKPGINMMQSSHVALVNLHGVIGTGGGGSERLIIKGIRDAFDSKNSKAVVLSIDSPGGSPVQASHIFKEIRRLRALYPGKVLYVVIGDTCASGGYYVAAAADKIFANAASVVGSIGVLIDQFGFVGTMRTLGIERRLMTAGENKGFLDPFSPIDTDTQTHTKHMLSQIHQQFIDAVKLGRGDRLSSNDEIFSGLVWTGKDALNLGLVDAFGDIGFVAREELGVEAIVDYTPKQDIFELLTQNIGIAIGKGLSRAFSESSLKLW